MEKILDGLTVQEILPKNYSEKLKLLGIREDDYSLITEGAILEFLNLRLEEKFPTFYGKRTTERFSKEGRLRGMPVNKCIRIKSGFIKANEKKGHQDWTGWVDWDEILLTDYEGNPPERILDKSIEAMSLGYQDLTAVVVDEGKIPDPLLIGYKGGRRYLIDWWDKDFTTEEIIKLTNS